MNGLSIPTERKGTANALLIVSSGLLLGASYPPVPFGALAFVAFVPFFLLFETVQSYWRGIRLAYAVFFIFNALTLYWAGGFTHGKDIFLMLAGAALLAFHPIFFLITIPPFIFIKKHFGYAHAVLTFPCIWVAFEYLHSLSEYSFPWLDLGNTQTYDLAAIQMASFTGVYGISFWILAANVSLYFFSINIARRRWRFPSGISMLALAGLLLLYVAPKIAGRIMLRDEASAAPEQPVKVSLIQPNIDPFDKWVLSPEAQVALQESLTIEAGKRRPDLVVWSETAIPYFILHPANFAEYEHLKFLVDSLGINLLTGIPDRIYYPDSATAPRSSRTDKIGRRYDDFNSSMLLQHGVKEIEQYHKIKLVPYAERVPYSELLSFMNAMQWNFGLGGWGIGRDTTIFSFLDRQGRPVQCANLICYESIYPGFVRDFVRKGAKFLVVITNDSWWGNTSGTYQHKQIAVLRAIENRRWVVQCANGGISCVIDPYGRILQATSLYTQAIVTAEIVPQSTKTFYTENGDWFPELCLIAALFILGAGGSKMYYERVRRVQMADRI